MSDPTLEERLRVYGLSVPGTLHAEAADRIEMLTEECDRYRARVAELGDAVVDASRVIRASTVVGPLQRVRNRERWLADHLGEGP